MGGITQAAIETLARGSNCVITTFYDGTQLTSTFTEADTLTQSLIIRQAVAKP